MKLNLESVRAIVDKQNDKIYYVIQDLIEYLYGDGSDKWKPLKLFIKNKQPDFIRSIIQIKVVSKKDGKSYLTDVAELDGLFLIAQYATSAPMYMALSRFG